MVLRWALLLFMLPCLAYANEPTKLTTKELCSQLTTYQPMDNVEYEPGKDVYGGDVAPADLDDRPQIQLPESTLVAITVDQASQLGLVGNLPFKPEAFIGEVTVDQTGNVYFNSKRISEPQLQVLCKDHKKK